MEKIDRKSAKQIIPEEAQNLFLQFASSLSDNKWAIGDLAYELTQEIHDVAKSVIDSACGVFVGLSGSRVADMRAVSRYYPPDIRKGYDHILSFSHFQAAKSAGDIDKSLDWLSKCIESMDDYGGTPMPVDKLRALMSEAGENQDQPVYVKRFKTIKKNLEKMRNDGDYPFELEGWITETIDQIQYYQDTGVFGDYDIDE